MRNRQAGFTLIELLIVVVIIGLLAAIALPKFGYTKEKAYISSMKSDLRNLSTAQEAYWTDHQTYYAGTVPGTGFIFSPSANVTITITEGTPVGWGASTAHVGTAVICALFSGTAAPPSPATVEGSTVCQ